MWPLPFKHTYKENFTIFKQTMNTFSRDQGRMARSACRHKRYPNSWVETGTVGRAADRNARVI